MENQSNLHIINVTNELVSKRWKQQYYIPSSQSWKTVMLPNNSTSKSTYQALLKIEATNPTNYDAINKLMGNTAWTQHACDSCHTSSRDPLIRIEDGSYSQSDMCLACLQYAVKILTKQS